MNQMHEAISPLVSPAPRQDPRNLKAESGSLEQDADVVMFVYREEYYLRHQRPLETPLEKFLEWQNKMTAAAGKTVILGKNRHGADVHFAAEFMRLGKLERQREIPEQHL